MRPQGITSQLIARLGFRGAQVGLVYLCRHCRSTPFSADDVARMQRMTTLLGALEAAWRATSPSTETEMLTKRERQIALQVARGLRNREIALVFGTSVNTVRNQLAALYEKLGVDGRAELAAWTIHARLDG